MAEDKEDIDILKDFEQKLIESQQDLPEDFQKVLNDNIWDLYQE